MQKTIYHAGIDSPWGSLFLAGTDKGICSCVFVDGDNEADLIADMLKVHSNVLVKEDIAPLAPAVEVLKSYFSGELGYLRYPLDLRGSPFQLQVWAVLRQIPQGKVATYGEIAARIGKPRGARAVGQACGCNPVVLFIPCHRVVAAHGKLGGFASDLNLKEALLRHEGISSFQRSAIKNDH